MLAQQLRQLLLQLPDPGVQTAVALLGIGQISLQRGLADQCGSSSCRRWLSPGGVNLLQQVTVPVEKRPLAQRGCLDSAAVDKVVA